MENKKKIIITIIIILTIVLGIIFIYIENQNSYTDLSILEELDNEIITNETVNTVENNTENTNKIVENKEKIAVHITGEVKKTGIIYLKEGARIADAIKEAGGATKNADLNKVNLAYVLSDGQKIYIPNKNDKEGKIQYIISDSGENIVVEEAKNGKGVNEKVNINTANKEELETLKGIGESLAQQIIEYRESNGKFQNIEEIQNVKGIGDSKYSNIKDSICI